MRYLFCGWLVLVLWGSCWGKSPNVVLVMTDDQGYGDLACHGNPTIITPNLDRLFAKSVRLTDFHVSPACAPTRAGLLTGRCPSRNGVWHVVMGRTQLPGEEVTTAELFSAAGYQTAIFGKWHLGDNYPMRPQDQGFDEVLVHGGGVVGHTPDYWLNDYFDDTYLHNGKPEKCAGYCTDVWFDYALKFIERNRDVPFFVYLPLNAPHQPFQVPEKYEAPYRDDPNVPNAAFYGMITCIDENMGRLEDALKRWGLDRDTILIFLTDNGTSAGMRRRDGRTVGFNAGMRGAKASAYDGGHRVPCWFHWPAGELAGGRDVERLADHVDILPTLLELCGIDAPEDLHFDGTSLGPLLRGDAADWPDRTLVAELQLVLDRPEMWRRSAVMTDRWRLVNGEELYDIKADPGQRRDVAADYPEMVAKLRGDYQRWWSSVSTTHGRIPEIVLGSDRQNPTHLTCYHWNNQTQQQRDMPWAHTHIVAGPLQNGFWWVKVDRKGRYRFTLRRWPVESGLAINATSDAVAAEKSWHPLEPGNLVASKARLKIQDVDVTLPVDEGARAVTFTVSLAVGSTRLETWFMDERGNSRGAYYVEVQRLGADAWGRRQEFDPAIAALDRAVELDPDAPGNYQRRGELHFKAANIRKSIEDFDHFLKLLPDREPHHWQRGISYYYAGEYEKGARQFELHKTVNPADVENAVWHYLCNAKVSDPQKARAALIQISHDSRPWAMTVYRMYRGELTPQEALANANLTGQTQAQRRNDLFYTHLYVGLYHESFGRADLALKHIQIAAEKYPSSHYMGHVARVALELHTTPKPGAEATGSD